MMSNKYSILKMCKLTLFNKITRKRKRKNLIVGIKGKGKELLIITITSEEYDSFLKFCNQNNYKIHILENNTSNCFTISCEKTAYYVFKE